MVLTVRGRSSRIVVPAPRRVSRVTSPPSLSTFSRTIAMPRPRPEMSVTIGLVETPDWKMNARISESPMACADSAETSPDFTTASLTL